MHRPRAARRINEEAKRLRSLADDLLSGADRLEAIAERVVLNNVETSRSAVYGVASMIEMRDLGKVHQRVAALIKDELTPNERFVGGFPHKR